MTAAFEADGAPQPLPERYVPGAYREWGVELFDWQSQCSVEPAGGVRQLRCARCAGSGGARRPRWQGTGHALRPRPGSEPHAAPLPPRPHSSSLRRLMPTVGCEADAVAFVEEATTSAGGGGAGAAADAGDALAVLPDGSYTSGPAAFDAAEASRLRFEACFAAEGLSREGAPASAPGAAGAPRYRLKVRARARPRAPPARVRLDASTRAHPPWRRPGGAQGAAAHPCAPRRAPQVAQNLARNWVDGSWRVASVELHRERWAGRRRGGGGGRASEAGTVVWCPRWPAGCVLAGR